MNKPSFLMILAGFLSFGAAIVFVSEWSAAFGASDKLVFNAPLLLGPVSFGTLAAALAYLIGLANCWKQMPNKLAQAVN